ncbi:hypothetical protein EDB83DRAFT_2362717 [Lactarius deliciosus]|nr:hypothetical protein EDB83DRAFT_2362717 [Lactarius deliciosus]
MLVTAGHVGPARIFRYFHCRDFRASPQHTLHPAAQVISACAELSRRLVSGKGSAEDARAP